MDKSLLTSCVNSGLEIFALREHTTSYRVHAARLLCLITQTADAHKMTESKNCELEKQNNGVFDVRQNAQMPYRTINR